MLVRILYNNIKSAIRGEGERNVNTFRFTLFRQYTRRVVHVCRSWREKKNQIIICSLAKNSIVVHTQIDEGRGHTYSSENRRKKSPGIYLQSIYLFFTYSISAVQPFSLCLNPTTMTRGTAKVPFFKRSRECAHVQTL